MKVQRSEVSRLKLKKSKIGILTLLISFPAIWCIPAISEVSPSGQRDHSNSCVRILATGSEVGDAIQSPFIYHVMPWLFEGGLDQIRQEIPKFRSLGVNTLWLGPVHPQTTMVHHYIGDGGRKQESLNDHGYWPVNHAAVAEELGGVSALKKLINAAHSAGIRVLLDAPLNHYGYGDEVWFEGKKISIQDNPDLFVRDDALGVHYEHLDRHARTDEEILRAQDALAGRRLAGLNDLDLTQYRVREYLITSYKLFVDLGIDGIRLDAVKHLPRSFTAAFINELSNYAQHHSRKLTFLVELLIHDAHRFNVIKRDIMEQVASVFRNRVYFIDFPFQAEFRRFDRWDHGFSDLMGFVRYREGKAQDSGNLIPMLVDHDLGEPIRNAFLDLMLIGLGEALSPHPLIIHHGNEGLSRLQTSRQSINEIDGSAEKTQMQKVIRALWERGDYSPNDPIQVYRADYDVLVLERSGRNNSLLIVVNKGFALQTTIFRAAMNYRRKIVAGDKAQDKAQDKARDEAGDEGVTLILKSASESGLNEFELSVPARSLAIYEGRRP